MRLFPLCAAAAIIPLAQPLIAADAATSPLSPHGAYKAAPWAEVMQKLGRGTPAERDAAMGEITAHADCYPPFLFYPLAAVLFQQGRKDDAVFWFYAGQLRTRYDANRCTDPSVGSLVGALNMQFGGPINQYAFLDRAKLKTVIQRVLTWDAETPHNYDPRSIALHGMAAFTGEKATPFVDEKTWPEVAEKTRATWWAGFRLAVGDNPEDYFTDATTVALVRAATAGDMAKIDALAKDGADVNAVGKDDATPLWFAYLSGNRAGFVRLLELGADPTRRFKAMRMSVLDSARQREDDDYFSLLLDHKLDPNTKDGSGEPLIHKLAGFGSDTKLRLLVERGADVNARTAFGETAIAQAAMLRQYTKVLYLLDHGADPALQDKLGNDVAAGVFFAPNLTPEREQQRQQVIAKLEERGFKIDADALAKGRVMNLKQAAGEEPPKFLSRGGINPAWAALHPTAPGANRS